MSHAGGRAAGVCHTRPPCRARRSAGGHARRAPIQNSGQRVTTHAEGVGGIGDAQLQGSQAELAESLAATPPAACVLHPFQLRPTRANCPFRSRERACPTNARSSSAQLDTDARDRAHANAREHFHKARHEWSDVLQSIRSRDKHNDRQADSRNVCWYSSQ